MEVGNGHSCPCFLVLQQNRAVLIHPGDLEHHLHQAHRYLLVSPAYLSHRVYHFHRLHLVIQVIPVGQVVQQLVCHHVIALVILEDLIHRVYLILLVIQVGQVVQQGQEWLVGRFLQASQLFLVVRVHLVRQRLQVCRVGNQSTIVVEIGVLLLVHLSLVDLELRVVRLLLMRRGILECQVGQLVNGRSHNNYLMFDDELHEL